MKKLFKKLFKKESVIINEPTLETKKFKVIKADTITELKSLVEAEKFFDAFDFELYYKLKEAKK
ncbi:hypothetical protein UFOVP105_39 [uncultured Caudovirales phage]|uniref:Uncharacterized protein n=1 Tax=uncultured Caudovirales phage TaxID=2100421 RepID=A0A6J5L0W6_9CAUD|nr:hypothetical protein UFOVP105_39 [uncultured Caudovirales phage]